MHTNMEYIVASAPDEFNACYAYMQNECIAFHSQFDFLDALPDEMWIVADHIFKIH